MLQEFDAIAEMIVKGESKAAHAAIAADPAWATAVGSFDDTLLHYAAASGDIKVMELLLRHGSNINARGDKGETPLHRAVCENERSKPVEALLKFGADPNIADGGGNTPIYWAASAEKKSMAKLLKRHNATIDFFTEVSLSSPGKVFRKLKNDPALLQQIPNLPKFAWQAIWEQETELVEFLLDHGLDPNARNESQLLLYFLLNRRSPVRMLEAFLSHGADPNGLVFLDRTVGVTEYIIEEYARYDHQVYPIVPELQQRLVAAGGKSNK